VLSLGAGVQSTTLLLLAAHRAIPRFDAVIFADTGWEPREVYDHLTRLEHITARAGMPLHRVSAGHIRADALDPAHRFASMPLFTLGPQGQRGMARRQCTAEYKIRPIKAKVRDLLGYPHPQRVPAGVYSSQAIGISTDEIHRARDADVGYLRNVFPLLDLGWTRTDCRVYLNEHGMGDTPKSACLGCPFHGNTTWRRLRDGSPAEWADVVAFDTAIRNGRPRPLTGDRPARGTFYLHHSRRPLAQADLGSRRDGADPDGCSPWCCRSGNPGRPATSGDRS
jgi:Phosphoadenosine phosphosulfate reductase family